MQYPFPPPPPGYLVVLVARWLLVVWTLFAVGILIVRLRNWKFIRVRELAFWSCAALISAIVSKYGICRYRAFDNNDWLMPTVMAAMSVSVAGAAMGLSKLYADRSGQAKTNLPEASVAIAIVCVLVALLIEEPVDSSGAGQNCRRNLRELGLAMHNYQDEHGAFPSFRRGDEPVSWRVSLLPSLDQLPLFDSYDQSLPWNRPPNDKAALQRVKEFVCSANYAEKHNQGWWFTSYSLPTGSHTVGDNSAGTPINRITDGLSTTLLVVEACGSQIIWTEPRDVDITAQPTGINLKGSKPGHSSGWLSSYHRGGTYVTLADGSVRFLSAKTDPSILKKLATIDGGEDLRSSDFER